MFQLILNMRLNNTLLLTLATLSFIALQRNTASAQVSVWDEERRGSLYFGVGEAIMENYSNSTIHIDQSSLGNTYVLNKLAGSNSGSGGGSFSPLSLNYRLGYFFSYRQDWGFELNFDPTTYYVKDGQKTPVSGTMNGTPYSGTITFSAANGYKYSLNGGNLILLNVVKRFGLFWGRTHKVRFDAFVKAGVGPVMPKATATLNGPANSPQMQFSGINGGVEGALRATLFRYIYFEVAAKYDYASFSGMKVYEGTAKQNLAVTSVVGTVGITLPTTKHHPLYEKGEKKRRVVTIKPMYPGKE